MCVCVCVCVCVFVCIIIYMHECVGMCCMCVHEKERDKRQTETEGQRRERERERQIDIQTDRRVWKRKARGREQASKRWEERVSGVRQPGRVLLLLRNQTDLSSNHRIFIFKNNNDKLVVIISLLPDVS